MTPTQSPETPTKRVSRRTGAAVLLAGLVGGATIGLVATVPSITSAAATSTTVAPTTVAPSADTNTDSAKTDANGTDRVAERTARVREQLQALVDDQTINAEQADAVASHLAETAPIPGHGGPGQGGGLGGLFKSADADAFAQVLGLADGEELRTELQSGKTIAQIAEENGVELQTVKDYLIGQLSEHLDAAVESGKLTREQADTMLAEAESKITEMINSNRPPRGPRGGAGDDGQGGTSDGPNIIDPSADA